MTYSREEYWRNTRRGLYFVLVLWLIGIGAVWMFFKSVERPPIFYEAPRLEAPESDEPLVAERDDTA